MNDREVLEQMANDPTLYGFTPAEEETIRNVLAELADCERDHPPEPWASELKAENERLSAKIEATLALHKAVRAEIGLPDSASPRCKTCRSERWPCPTVKALNT